ncbi:hypothetical protein ONZ45_g10228 [Pleurotus djamor]|nr:hypothetical protein ONZ45_g10228 [Pleurotus djamor]
MIAKIALQLLLNLILSQSPTWTRHWCHASRVLAITKPYGVSDIGPTLLELEEVFLTEPGHPPMPNKERKKAITLLPASQHGLAIACSSNRYRYRPCVSVADAMLSSISSFPAIYCVSMDQCFAYANMRFLTTLFSLIALFDASVSSTPVSLKSIHKFSGTRVEGGYIVKLKAGASKRSLFRSLGLNVTNEWDAAFNGFSGSFSNEALDALRASADVDFVAEDGIMSILSAEASTNILESAALVTQTNAPWGIARLTSNTRLANQNPADLNFQYVHDPLAGSGVDVYVVDTGISVTHADFGGRAVWGATFGGFPSTDGNGHGTHVAWVDQYLAKSARVIAVKVLSDAGSGTVSGIISGLNYVAQSAQASGRPTVINLSLGGGASAAFDNAVTAILQQGIHIVAAAGGSNTDAGGSSPGRVPGVLTIDITSDYIASPGYARFSGTSMASAHVAGIVAYFLYTDGPMSPGAMSNLIIERSLKDVLSNIPTGTPNRLAHIPV